MLSTLPEPRPDGCVESKIDRITELQAADYFVVVLFVGLSDVLLSVGKVLTRVAKGGHATGVDRLIERYHRTQTAIRAAARTPMPPYCWTIAGRRQQHLPYTVSK